MSLAALPEETMGTSLVFLLPFKNWGRFNGRPAPEKIISIPSSIEAFTISEKSVRAVIILTPSIPPVFLLASLISSRNATIFDSLRLSPASVFLIIPIPAVAITPIPPSLATEEASEDIDIPTPIPPCMIGIFATRFPIFKFFNLISSFPKESHWYFS